MSLFITTTKRPTSGSSGDSRRDTTVVWDDYQRKLAMLDSVYRDGFGNVKTEIYYDKWQEIVSEALVAGIAPGKQDDIIKEMNNLRTERNKFNLKSSVGSDGLEEVKTGIDSLWKNVWSDKEFLNSGNVSAMLGYMEESINSMKMELEAEHQFLVMNSVDSDVIEASQSVLDELSRQEAYYRRASMTPEEHALQFNTNSQGEVTDLKIVNINNLSGGYDYSGIDYGGYSVYGTPNKAIKGKLGEESFRIGNLGFRRLGSEGDFTPKEEGSELDFTSLYIQDPLSARIGSTLMTPSGVGYIKQQDGTFFKVNQSLAPSAGVNLEQGGPVSTITEEDANKIERSQPVDNYIRDVERVNQTLDPNQLQNYFTPNQGQSIYSQPFPGQGQVVNKFLNIPSRSPEPKGEQGSFEKTTKSMFTGQFKETGLNIKKFTSRFKDALGMKN